MDEYKLGSKSYSLKKCADGHRLFFLDKNIVDSGFTFSMSEEMHDLVRDALEAAYISGRRALADQVRCKLGLNDDE